MAKKKVFYVLLAEAEGVEAEFFVNDVPIVRRSGEGAMTDYSGPCNQDLVPGWNVITAVIGPGPTPSSTLRGSPGRRRVTLEKARVQARLMRYPEGAVSGAPGGDLLAQLEWEAPDLVRPVTLPRVVSAGVDLGPLGGRWRWQDATPLTLDEPTLREVRTFLETLHAMLSKKDLERFLALTQVRLSDVERAFERRAGEKAAEVLNAVKGEVAKPEWGMLPLEPEAWDLRLCGGNRLIDCVRRDGAPILRETPRAPTNISVEWPVRVAKLDGVWHVAR
jgi:hypothetical protein